MSPEGLRDSVLSPPLCVLQGSHCLLLKSTRVILRGSRRPNPFTEHFAFLRQKGRKSDINKIGGDNGSFNDKSNFNILKNYTNGKTMKM